MEGGGAGTVGSGSEEGGRVSWEKSSPSGSL